MIILCILLVMQRCTIAKIGHHCYAVAVSMKEAVTSVDGQEHGDTSGTAYLSYLQTTAQRSAP
jgi:hypothetical protein